MTQVQGHAKGTRMHVLSKKTPLGGMSQAQAGPRDGPVKGLNTPCDVGRQLLHTGPDTQSKYVSDTEKQAS